MRHGVLSIWLLLLVLTTVSFANEGQGDDQFNAAPTQVADHLLDRFSVRLGGFAVRFKTSAQVDSETFGPGTELDLENDTNLSSDETVGRLDGHFRFGKRHRINYGFMSFKRNALRVIDEEIQFGDAFFDIDTELKTKLSTNMIKLAYRYDLVQRPRWDLGLSFGVSAFDVNLDIAATSARGVGAVAQSEDFIAPIPMLGLHTNVHLGKNWYFRASGEIFDVSVDNRQADVSDLQGSFDWYPFKHWGFGIGFNRLRMSYDESRVPNVSMTYVYSGTMVYVSYVR
jgi:hypothetical protein